LHKVERIGMGIQKIKEAMIAAGLAEPTFAADAFFRAIFHRSTEFALKNGKLRTEAVGEHRKAKTAQKIIALIQRSPEITPQEMVTELGITDSGVKYHLKKIQDKGLLRCIGSDKAGHWEVIRQPK